MRPISHVSTVPHITCCWWSLGGCRRPARITLEKFHQNGHLMVPSCPAVLSSLCGTILAAVGGPWSIRSTEATPWHVGLVVQASSSWSCWPRLDYVSHVSCVRHANRLTCISVAGHISCPCHANRACMHKSYTLLMVLSARGPLLKSCGFAAILWSHHDQQLSQACTASSWGPLADIGL